MRISVTFYLACFCYFVSYAQTYYGSDAERKIPNTNVIHYNGQSTPAYIKIRPGYNIPQQSAIEWLKNTLQLSSAYNFALLKTTQDELGYTHQRYQQYYNGFPVETGIYILHFRNGYLHSANGVLYDSLQSNAYPNISENTALQKALEYTGASVYQWEVPELEQHFKREQRNPDATYYPKGTLMYAPKNHVYSPENFQLSYKFDIYAHEPLSHKYVYVDARTGEIVLTQDLIHTIDSTAIAHTRYSGTQTMKTSFVSTNLFHLKETSRSGVETYNMQNGTNYAAAVDFVDFDNIWNNVNAQQDEVATDAHWGAEITYDYFKDVHNRLSYDGADAPLYSYVHYSNSYLNAFWDGSRMTYGDGSGAFGPLTCIDIVGHELTHGVTGNSAGLIYYSESGALNESFSDIFGKCIEKAYRPSNFSWIIGKDIHTLGTGLRSMSNPNANGNPDTYHGTYWYFGAGDNAGVHTNSGVQNYWFYLLCEGGTGTNDIGNNFNVTAIGFNKAEKIAYRNLSVYLTPSSNYADARFYSLMATGDLYGYCSAEYASVANAWYAVGIGNAYTPGVQANFETPVQNFCYVPVSIEFKNLSNNAFTYQWNFGNSTTSTLETPTAVYTQAGNYTVKLTVDGGCGKDTVIKTDYIQINTLNQPVTNNKSICQGESATLIANKSGTGEIYWYNSLTNTTPVFIGDTFITPALTSNTTYYAAYETKKPVQNLGALDTTFASAFNTVSANYYLFFDVYKDMILDSVTVYSTQAGNREIQVLDDNGNVVISKTVNIGVGKQQIYLGFLIPIGSNYRIGLPSGSLGRLYRNFGTIPYPYTVSGLASIKKSSVSNNYFYFYDWKVRERNCTSVRSAATVSVKTKPSVPAIFASGGGLMASATPTTHYQWFLAGNPISGATSNSYIPSVTGNYTVIAYNDGCASEMSANYYYVSSSIADNSILSQFYLYPNPVQEAVYVHCTADNKIKQGQIVNVQGQTVQEFTVNQGITRLNVSHLPKGVYFVRITGYKTEKLIKE